MSSKHAIYVLGLDFVILQASVTQLLVQRENSLPGAALAGFRTTRCSVAFLSAPGSGMKGD